MKAILLSIRPEWCDLIIRGKKTLEVRKTRSDLKIYDHPRPLSDFTRLRATKFGYEPVRIERPPQSWCYVMEE